MNGRKAYLIWSKLAPENAQSLFAQFDLQSQKAVHDEEQRFTELDEFDLPPPREESKTMTSFPIASVSTAGSVGTGLGGSMRTSGKEPASAGIKKKEIPRKTSASRGHRDSASRASKTHKNNSSVGRRVAYDDEKKG